MKTSNDFNLRSGNNQPDRESQLYHKHTFGSMGNNYNSPTNIRQYYNKKGPLPSIQNIPYEGTSPQITPTPPQMEQIYPPRQIKTSILSTAISSLTYGLSCLIYETETNVIYECLMMIHQEYINILHVIINRSISYLLKLNDVKSITDQDTFVASKLNGLNINNQLKQNYIVLHLKSLKSIVFLFRTQHQKFTIHLGLKFFLNQGKLFYSKLSQYDPFKAQSMMLFLQADKDGGNLLDIQEIISILEELKINKEKIDIQTDVLEINKSLYERENMKRPKNASPHQLTPIAFEYLLRFYSIKEQLLKFFKQYCPMFKPKNKNHKNTIIDIIKNNQKPIMSSFQLKQFYKQILKQDDKSLQEFDEIIKKFPVYDGQGKEKFDMSADQILLSFDNFCNLICSKENSLLFKSEQGQSNQLFLGFNKSESEIHENKKPQKHYLSYSLLNYHIYTDLSMKNLNRKQKSNFFTLALKRGVKCINLQLNLSMLNTSSKTSSLQFNSKNMSQSQQKLRALVVRIDQKEKQQLILDDILKDVKMYAFDKNALPFFIVLDIDSLFKQPNYVQYLQLLNQVIQDSLDKDSIFIFMGNKEEKRSLLPTPLQLQGKIILMTTLNPKMLQKSFALKKQIQIPKSLTKKITFNAVKLDFQRKGQNCWNICFIDLTDLKNYESAQEQNICNYSKKLMLFGTRKDMNLAAGDSFSCFRQGFHFVGQNFQRNKQNNYILHSKFAQLPDEYFGYRLKPQYMHSQNTAPLYSNKNFTKQLATRIKFNVLIGQKMILNDFPFEQFYVEVSVKGSVLDEQNNKVYKSDKKTQGFYSEINLECEFVVYNEQLFTIFVVVRNCENNKILGARGVSLKKMRQGLRSLQLFNERMQTKQNSYLLVHYIKKQIALKDERATKMQQFLK